MGRSNAVSAGYVAPCTNSRILSGDVSLPAGCLLRTNSWMPGSPDGIMVSVASSLGLFACAPAPAKVLATRQAKPICKNLLVIVVLPGRCVLGAGLPAGRSSLLERTGYRSHALSNRQ